jgi:hypothetical protein
MNSVVSCGFVRWLGVGCELSLGGRVREPLVRASVRPVADSLTLPVRGTLLSASEEAFSSARSSLRLRVGSSSWCLCSGLVAVLSFVERNSYVVT